MAVYNDSIIEATVSSELVVNGDFSADTNWTKGSGWTISGGVASCSGTSININQQIAGMAIGKTYIVTYTILNYVSGSISFDFGAAGEQSISRNTNGTFTQVVTKKGGGTYLYFFGGSFVGSIDNISIKEVINTSNFDFQDGANSITHIENTNTNLIQYPKNFNNAAWPKDHNVSVDNSGKVLTFIGQCYILQQFSGLIDNSTYLITWTMRTTEPGKNICPSIEFSSAGASLLGVTAYPIVTLSGTNITYSRMYKHGTGGWMKALLYNFIGNNTDNRVTVIVDDVTVTLIPSELLIGANITNPSLIESCLLGSELNTASNLKFAGIFTVQDANTSIATGNLVVAGGLSASIGYFSIASISIGRSYEVTYTISSITGSLFMSPGGGTVGPTRTTPGTYTEILLFNGPRSSLEPQGSVGLNMTMTSFSIKEAMYGARDLSGSRRPTDMVVFEQSTQNLPALLNSSLATDLSSWSPSRWPTGIYNPQDLYYYDQSMGCLKIEKRSGGVNSQTFLSQSFTVVPGTVYTFSAEILCFNPLGACIDTQENMSIGNWTTIYHPGDGTWKRITCTVSPTFGSVISLRLGVYSSLNIDAWFRNVQFYPIIKESAGAIGPTLASVNEPAPTNLFANPDAIETTSWLVSNSGTIAQWPTSPLGSFPPGITTCNKIAISAGQTNAYNYQILTLLPDTRYTVEFWVFIPNNVPSTKALFSIMYVNVGWQGISNQVITERDVWVYKEHSFITNPTYTQTVVAVGLGTTTPNLAMYIAKASLTLNQLESEYAVSSNCQIAEKSVYNFVSNSSLITDSAGWGVDTHASNTMTITRVFDATINQYVAEYNCIYNGANWAYAFYSLYQDLPSIRFDVTKQYRLTFDVKNVSGGVNFFYSIRNGNGLDVIFANNWIVTNTSTYTTASDIFTPSRSGTPNLNGCTSNANPLFFSYLSVSNGSGTATTGCFRITNLKLELVEASELLAPLSAQGVTCCQTYQPYTRASTAIDYLGRQVERDKPRYANGRLLVEGTTNLIVANANLDTTQTVHPGWDEALNGTLAAAGWYYYNPGVPAPTTGYHTYSQLTGGYYNGPCLVMKNRNAAYGYLNRWIGTSVGIDNNALTNITVGTKINISFYLKGDTLGHTGSAGIYRKKKSDGLWGFDSLPTFTPTIANTWERKSLSINFDSDWDTTGIASLYICGYTVGSPEGTFYIDDAQVEVKDYATPFTVGKRDPVYATAIQVEDATTNLLEPDFGKWSSYITGGATGTRDFRIDPIYGKVLILNKTDIETGRFGINRGFTGMSGKSFTTGLWVRRLSGTGSISAPYIDSHDTTGAFVSILNTKTYLQLPLNTWTYITGTITTTDTLTDAYNNSGYVWVDGTAGTYEFAWPQLELKSYPTSFMNGYRAQEAFCFSNPDYLPIKEGTVEFRWMCNRDKATITSQTTSPIILQLGNYYSNSSLTIWNWFGAVPGTAPILRILIKGQTNQDWSGLGIIKDSATNWYTPNTWYHIAVKWTNGNYFTCYLNGVNCGTTYIEDPITSFANNYLSLCSNFAGSNAGGYASSLKVHRRQLSDAEVLAAYNLTTEPVWDANTALLYNLLPDPVSYDNLSNSGGFMVASSNANTATDSGGGSYSATASDLEVSATPSDSVNTIWNTNISLIEITSSSDNNIGTWTTSSMIQEVAIALDLLSGTSIQLGSVLDVATSIDSIIGSQLTFRIIQEIVSSLDINISSVIDVGNVGEIMNALSSTNGITNVNGEKLEITDCSDLNSAIGWLITSINELGDPKVEEAAVYIGLVNIQEELNANDFLRHLNLPPNTLDLIVAYATVNAEFVPFDVPAVQNLPANIDFVNYDNITQEELPKNTKFVQFTSYGPKE